MQKLVAMNEKHRAVRRYGFACIFAVVFWAAQLLGSLHLHQYSHEKAKGAPTAVECEICFVATKPFKPSNIAPFQPPMRGNEQTEPTPIRTVVLASNISPTLARAPPAF